jgi:acetolactate decarboxylase
MRKKNNIMKGKLIAFFIYFAATLLLFTTGCVSSKPDTVSQVSTIDALLAGVYDGELTLEQLVEMGDTGIGTFDSLDGEMVVLDGKVYQVKSDGKVYTPPMQTTTPFASVVAFSPERCLLSTGDINFNELQKILDEKAPRKNLFYAFKITGRFEFMKTRSVPRQKKPFPPLAEVVKNQPVFEMENVAGIVVGFRCPPFVKGINVPGYHLHFISDDRKRGGHILDFKMKQGAFIEIDSSDKFFMVLPSNRSGFDEANLAKDRSKELHKVEK